MEHRRPTLVDVARLAGVSRSTASRAINDQSGVTAEARQRVRRAVETLRYHPDGAARSLASGRAEVLDLVVIDEDPHAFANNPYYSRVTAGMLEALAGSDVPMRIHLTPRATAGGVLDAVATSAGIGTLLVNVPAPAARRFQRRCPRVVSIGRFGDRVPFTETDSFHGATMAVAHLVAEGRRVIAAIDGPADNPCAAQRHAGYVEAMTSAGLHPLWTDGDFRRAGGYDATLRLLDAHPGIDAIFAACDLTATGAVQALTASGRRVPDDVAVAGFDDSVLASSSTPPLTSVRQPVEEMAAQATRDLLHGDVGPGWQRWFPVSLMVRSSTMAGAA